MFNSSKKNHFVQTACHKDHCPTTISVPTILPAKPKLSKTGQPSVCHLVLWLRSESHKLSSATSRETDSQGNQDIRLTSLDELIFPSGGSRWSVPPRAPLPLPQNFDRSIPEKSSISLNFSQLNPQNRVRFSSVEVVTPARSCHTSELSSINFTDAGFGTHTASRKVGIYFTAPWR